METPVHKGIAMIAANVKTRWLVIFAPLLVFASQANAELAERPIADFESDAELKRLDPAAGVKLDLSTEKVKSGKQSLKVSFPTGPYPGFSFRISKGNWMGPDVLRIRVHSPKRIAFGVRIDGANSRSYDTRFNLEAEVHPGWNLFQIPITDIAQKIDITKVTRLVLFAMKPPAGLVLHIDQIALGAKFDEPARETTEDVPLATGPDFDLSALELTTLFDFEKPGDAKSASVEGKETFEIATEKPKTGKSSLRLRLPKGPYPGVALAPPSKDWREFDLVLAWVHASRPLKLGVRIDDDFSVDYYTRFNKDGIGLGAGWNAVAIDLKEVAEVIELDRIKALVLFVLDCPGTVIHLDDIALARSKAKSRADTTLLDFEDEAELKRIGRSHPMSLTNEQVTSGKAALKVTLPPGNWPGISIDPPITDWSGHDALKFDVHCPRNSGFGIRIDDVNSRDYNSRYNDEGVVLKGWNTYQVDLRKIKPVNPATIRALVLFLMKNPAPTTVYFDNFRLGPLQEDIRPPVPGEEGPRRDITYSTEVETPHVKWAKPYHGGKIRAFAIPSIQHGRDLAELMQRMELEVTAVTIDPNWDQNAWGIGDYYFRGEQNDYRLVNKYVEDELTSDKEFDVLLLPTPMGWSDFTKDARRAILRRVRRGTGAVLIAPFRTKDETVDDRIWGLSPLVRVLDHSVPDDGYLRINWRSLADGEWEWTAPAEGPAAIRHFVLHGIPSELIPSRHLRHYRYRPSGTILAQAGNDPVIGVKSFGKGRVVALGYQNAGFTPRAIDPAKTGVTWYYWEYYYNLLVRSVIWAAGKESPVSLVEIDSDGKALRLKATSDTPREAEVEAHVKNQWGETELELRKPVKLAQGDNALTVGFDLERPACGMHLVDVILREGGKSLDWGTTVFQVARPAQITMVSVADTCPADGLLPVRAAAHNFQEIDLLRLRLEDQWGRIAFKAEAEAAKEVSVDAPVRGALSQFVRIVAELWRGETLLDRKVSKEVYLVPKEREKRQFRAELGWAGGWKRYLAPTTNRLIADRETEIGPIGRAFLNNSLGVRGLGFVRWNKDQYSKQKRLYHATKDKAYLIRNPCLSSPEYQNDLKKRVTRSVRAKARYRLSDYYVVDEGSLTSYGDAFDFCHSPHCLGKFREWLEAKYEDIETLNETWDTEYEEWEEVEPLTTDEAREADSFASWGDHRLFMCQVYAGTFKLVRDTVRQIDPDGLTVISGTQAPNPWNACDWYWLDQHIDHISCYSGGEQWALHRSFKPGALVGFWTGYGAHGPGVKHAIWSAFFQGITQPRIFWGYSFLDPDLTYSKSGFDMGEAFRAIKDSGLDRVVLEGKRLNDGIAIHYSFPSILAAEALGRRGQFESNKSAWVRLIKDVGLQFEFVAAPEIEAGALRKRGYRALILPMSTALSDEEVEQIDLFVKAGGALIADTQVGLMCENCASRDVPAWKELADRIIGGTIPLPEDLVETKIVRLGGGKMIGLGYPMDTYRGLRAKDYGGQGYRKAVGWTLAAAGIKPRLQVAEGALPNAEITTFALGSVLVVSILQEPIQTKTIRRVDGTVSFEGGGTAEGRTVRLGLGGEYDVTDVLARKRLGKLSEVEANILPGWPTVLALLPPGQVTGGLKLSAKFQEHVLRLSGEIPAPADQSRVFTVRLTDPNGRLHRLYYRAALNKTSSFELEIPFALNDPKGKWQVEATDILSGTNAGSTITY